MPNASSKSILSTFLVAAAIVAATVFGLAYANPNAWQSARQWIADATGEQSATVVRVADAETDAGATSTSTVLPAGEWAATAAGRVEPVGGEIAINPEMSGPVVAVYVSEGDEVKAGDLLFSIRDDELEARWEQARGEIDVRVRERAEDPTAEEDPKSAKKAEAWKAAADALADAELALYQARRDRDAADIAFRNGTGDRAALEAARKELADAEARVDEAARALDEERAKEGTPKPSRLEGSLETARDDLKLIEIAYQRAHVRAPIDGTILDVDVRVGEMAVTNPRAPSIRMGDVSRLEIRSEIDERDIASVKVGQSVIVRSKAFAGEDISGTVSSIAPALGRPKLSSAGPRQRADVDVVELWIKLDEETKLLPGMRVDVFFKPVEEKQAAAEAQ